MYLLSVGAKMLGKKAARIVGRSEETTCYVSPDYFAEDDDPFADFIAPVCAPASKLLNLQFNQEIAARNA
jgi:hypothetical protein